MTGRGKFNRLPSYFIWHESSILDHEEVIKWVTRRIKIGDASVRCDLGFVSVGVATTRDFTIETAKKIAHESPYDMYLGCEHGGIDDMIYIHFYDFKDHIPPSPRVNYHGLTSKQVLFSPYIGPTRKGKSIYGFSNNIFPDMMLSFKDDLPISDIKVDEETTKIIHENKIIWGMSNHAVLSKRTWKLTPEDTVMITLLR